MKLRSALPNAAKAGSVARGSRGSWRRESFFTLNLQLTSFPTHSREIKLGNHGVALVLLTEDHKAVRLFRRPDNVDVELPGHALEALAIDGAFPFR